MAPCLDCGSRGYGFETHMAPLPHRPRGCNAAKALIIVTVAVYAHVVVNVQESLRGGFAGNAGAIRLIPRCLL